MIQRRRVPGLRPVLFALVSVAGAIAAIAVPGAVGYLLGSALVEAVGGLGVPIAAFATFAVFLGMLHVLGRSLEEVVRLRSPWGRVAVGSDGLRWDAWIRRRFVPWSAVARFARRPEGVRVVRRDGRT
ncbi:MAG: hypothetical protein K8H88_13995, partial [Sandaracinaceae bacterium]|nr:hypothetical protein [Sandaracinaceae bacterium]